MRGAAGWLCNQCQPHVLYICYQAGWLSVLVEVATTGTHGDGFALHARAGLFGIYEVLFSQSRAQ
jgi:hypothetical protein